MARKKKMQVLRVVDLPSPVNGALVAMLTDLLQEAEKGRLRSFAFVGKGNDGTTWGGDTMRGDIIGMLGELRLLEYRLVDGIRAVNEGRV